MSLRFSFRKRVSSSGSDYTSFSPSTSNIPDVACTVFRTHKLGQFDSYCEFGGVSIRGSSHYQSGTSRQDSFVIFPRQDQIILALADGVSSSSLAQIGSSFVTLNLEKAVNSSFEGPVTGDIGKWNEVNAWLTRGLVGMFEAVSRKEGRSVPEDVLARRFEAGRKYATTLEVLVCDLNPSKDGSLEVLYVNLAGDGVVFHSASKALSAPLFLHRTKDPGGKVAALPICDSSPRIEKIEMGLDSYVALVSDGIGDQISSSKWLKRINRYLTRASMTTLSLHSLISEHDEWMLDDRTLLAIRHRS